MLTVAILLSSGLAALAVPAARATAAPRLAGRPAVTTPAVTVPTVGGLSVYVGYAEDKEINAPDPAAFPVPWAGAPNTTFLGGTVPGQSACGTLTVCYDGGAIRLDNPGTTPVTVSSVSVDDHSSVTGGKVFNNLWGSFTVQPGKSVILTANPPTNNPGYDNFDTSSYPNNNCTPLTVAPTVTITINAVATTLADSTHVLDTGGIDRGSCPPKENESIQWRPIGAPGGNDATLTIAPGDVTVTPGQPVTETATLLDGGGAALPKAVVDFAVTSGPDAGLKASVPTDSSGHATFVLPAAAQGKDIVTASVTTVGTFTAPDPSIVPCPAPWTCADIGSPAPAGTQSFDPNSGTWTISAGGADITGTSDQFRYVWQSLSGNGSVVAYVASQQDTSAAAKAGVMFRTSTDPAAPEYSLVVSPGQGVKVQVRKTQGGTTSKLANPAGTAPAWLKITRSGSTFTAYASPDGVTWTLIPGSSVTLTGLPATMLAGLAVTSHQNGTLGVVTMTNVAVG
jgi:hypothetical protein